MTHTATIQERELYNLWKKDKNATGMNLAFGFKTKNLDVQRLERAVNAIVSRHSHLRSVFFEESGVVLRKSVPSVFVRAEKFSSSNLCDFVMPFDLEAGPLVHLAVRGNTVLLDICHIATDGFSMALFFSELDSFYSGQGVQYEPTAVPSYDEKTISRNTDFWTGQFEKPFSPLFLPYDRDGSIAHGGDGNSMMGRIGGRTTQRVRRLCGKLSITPFVFYFSAFILFLSRECGSDDVVTATNLSCRSSRTMRTIALLANTAPVRLGIDDDMRVSDFLLNVSRFVRKSLCHQSFDVARLLDFCGVSDIRDISRTIFAYEHEKMANIRLGGEKCEFVPIPSRHSSTDFTLCFFPFKDSGQMLLIYREDLFSRGRARQLLRRYAATVSELLCAECLLSEI